MSVSTMTEFETRGFLGTKRISGINNNGVGYDLNVPNSCKFDNLTQNCKGQCSGHDKNCTLKRIQNLSVSTENYNDEDIDDVDWLCEKLIMDGKDRGKKAVQKILDDAEIEIEPIEETLSGKEMIQHILDNVEIWEG